MIQSFLSPTTLGSKLLPGATAPLHTINSQALMWRPVFPPTSLLKSLPLIDNNSLSLVVTHKCPKRFRKGHSPLKSQPVGPLRSLSRKQQEENLKMIRGCAYTYQRGATEQLRFALRPCNSQGLSDLKRLLNILCPFTILCTSKHLYKLQECSTFFWNWLGGWDFWVTGGSIQKMLTMELTH